MCAVVVLVMLCKDQVAYLPRSSLFDCVVGIACSYASIQPSVLDNGHGRQGTLLQRMCMPAVAPFWSCVTPHTHVAWLVHMSHLPPSQ
jgi:hypothetical protein